jgi:hypothetical protein
MIRIPSGDSSSRWVSLAAALAFVLVAAHFLYFFVDDEAIPYVYAQNLLHGHGLTYSTIEGPVEGYSDFLHVGQATAILAAVDALHGPKVAVFFVGKVVSFASGVAIVLLMAATLRRLQISSSGRIVGLALLVLTGPLAVWSCSSLETVPFALGVTVLTWALVSEHDTAAAAAAGFLILERIDGFVFAAALIGAFMVVADRKRRVLMVRHIVLPCGLLFCGYNIWRLLYFGDLLPMPLQSKILYKLTRSSHLVVKDPKSTYGLQFVALIGWPVAAALAAAALHGMLSRGPTRALAIAMVVLLSYVALAGDWMFGFRFFVPVFPLMCAIAASAAAALARWDFRLPRVVAVGSVLWFAITGVHFFQAYRVAEHMESFLMHPSRDLNRFFWPYYGLYLTARKEIPPHEVVAYNQAGFLPFMLDLTNIDDLGICSRFYAQMPTTDVFFTEVGRFSPLTNKRALRAGEAYLLHQNAQYVMVRMDLLLKNNDLRIPRYLLGGYYELLGTDGPGENAIYRRTAVPATPYTTSASAFLENLVHLSRVRAAIMNGMPVSFDQIQRQFRFLRDDRSELWFTDQLSLSFVFGRSDEAVHQLTIEEIKVSEPAVLELALYAADSRLVYRQTMDLPASTARAVWAEVPDGIKASTFELRLSLHSRGQALVRIEDLRVQGQTPQLNAYITSRLKFPAGS